MARDHATRHKPADTHLDDLVFPPDRDGECNEWCAGLHLIERKLADHPDIEFYDVADFMIMGALRRPGHPLLYMYKHVDTRRYLNIDGDGVPWRFVMTGPGDGRVGMYVRHPVPVPWREGAVDRRS